jgi:hypothetical protein
MREMADHFPELKKKVTMMKPLQPHQERVLAERDQLSERLEKLLAFFNSEIFSQVDWLEQSRMKRQAIHMERYLNVLNERIQAFNKI